MNDDFRTICSKMAHSKYCYVIISAQLSNTWQPSWFVSFITNTFSFRNTVLKSRIKSVSENIFHLYFAGFSSINDKVLPINENILRRMSDEIETYLDAFRLCVVTIKWFVGSNPIFMNLRVVKLMVNVFASMSLLLAVQVQYTYTS